MKDFTILEIKDLKGLLDEKLDIFRYSSKFAPITDYAISIGGFTSPFSPIRILDLDEYKGRVSHYWIKTKSKMDTPFVFHQGNILDYSPKSKEIGCRLCVPFESIYPYITGARRTQNGVLILEAGEYPQSAPNKQVQDSLNLLEQQNLLVETGDTYTIDSRAFDDNKSEIKYEKLKAYTYDNINRKFIKVKLNSTGDFYTKLFKEKDSIVLSNGENYKNGDEVWIEVEPIKWVLDESKGIAVSQKILFAGIQFDKNDTYDGNFSKTNLKEYIDEYFEKEIFQLGKKEDIKETIKELKLKF